MLLIGRGDLRVDIERFQLEYTVCNDDNVFWIEQVRLEMILCNHQKNWRVPFVKRQSCSSRHMDGCIVTTVTDRPGQADSLHSTGFATL